MYQEKEENMEFVFNFERMVNTMRDLKDSVSGTFKIRNVSKEELLIEISNGIFKATTPLGVVIFNEKLEDYSSIRLLIDKISEQTDFVRIEYDGNSEPATSINSFHVILNRGNIFNINVDNSIYKNISDVIEAGFVIITDRARVYSVVSAVPENDSYGNEYIGWKCMGKLENLTVVDTLPNDAKQLVQKLTYGLSKVNME
jgi:hypothetical protein